MEQEKIYTSDSPEVIAYREAFPDVELDAAIGSVISMRNAVISGGTIAISPDKVMEVGEIIKMIKESLKPETIEPESSEDDIASENEADDESDDEADDEESDEESDVD